MSQIYGQFAISSVKCRSAYPYSNSYGVSVWYAKNGNKGFITYGSAMSPYYDLSGGEPFLSGAQPRWLIKNDVWARPVTIDIDEKLKSGDRGRFARSKKNGEIVFNPYFVSRGTVRSIPGYAPIKDLAETVVLSGWMGLDGKFYYDAQNARLASGAYFNIEVTFKRQEVERRIVIDPSTAEWFPQGLSLAQPLYLVNTGVVTSALADANSGELDLLTEVLELPETVKYLITLMDAGGKATLRYRKKVEELTKIAKLKKAAQVAFNLADALASAWLQYRYAIMPIFYSIEDVRSALKAYARIYAKFKAKNTYTLEPAFNLPGWTVDSNVQVTERCIIKRAYDPETLIDKLLNILKLNPIASAWELVTLSFVVDWFLNIGDIIDALSGYDGSIQSSSCYSWKSVGTVTLNHKESGASIIVRIDEYKREVIEPSDHIGLSWNTTLTWKQQIDAISLMWGPISSRLQKQLK